MHCLKQAIPLNKHLLLSRRPPHNVQCNFKGRGGCLPKGGDVCLGGVSLPGGVCLGGIIFSQACVKNSVNGGGGGCLGDVQHPPPRGQNSWHTLVKTLPFRLWTVIIRKRKVKMFCLQMEKHVIKIIKVLLNFIVGVQWLWMYQRLG